LLNDSHISHLLSDPLQELSGDILMGYFSPPETNPHPHLSPIGQKLARLIDFDRHIVIGYLGTNANLLDLDLLLRLPRLPLTPRTLIHELAIIQQTTNRRIGIGRHLDEIQTSVVGQTLRLSQRIDPQLLAGFVNQSDFFGADLII
jgi:hypothetical protein